MPEGSARPVVVQAGLANEMISLEGYARRDSGAANLILSDDAHALAATPERVVTLGDFGDIVGQKATLYRAMSARGGLGRRYPRRDSSAIRRHAQDGARGRTPTCKRERSSARWRSLTGANDTGASAHSSATRGSRLGLVKRLASPSATMSSRSNLKTVLR